MVDFMFYLFYHINQNSTTVHAAILNIECDCINTNMTGQKKLCFNEGIMQCQYVQCL